MSNETTPRRSNRLAAMATNVPLAAVVAPSPRLASLRIQKRDFLASIPYSPNAAFVSLVPTLKKSILKTPRASSTTSSAAVTPDFPSPRRRRSGKKVKSGRLSTARASPSSAGTVKFGADSSARYDKRDPPNRFELIPANVVPTDAITAEKYDEETRRNEAILASWDEIASESESDSDDAKVERVGRGRGCRVVVEEEEIRHFPDSPNVTVRRRKRDTRTVVQRDVVFCKHCRRGTIRTSTFVRE